MTAKEIGAGLQKKQTAAGYGELASACARRRQAARARQTAIDPSGRPGLVPDPPAVTEAVLNGPDAVIDLNREREQLTIELELLDRLERMAYAAQTEARKEELRREIPAARKRVLREGVQQLRAAMANFDAKLAELNGDLAIVAEFDNAGVSYPFVDDELAMLLELRHEVWRVRILGVPHHIPAALADEPGEVGARVKQFARSWGLLYVKSRPGTLTTRKPPVETPQQDFARAPDAREKHETVERRPFRWPSLIE